MIPFDMERGRFYVNAMDLRTAAGSNPSGANVFPETLDSHGHWQTQSLIYLGEGDIMTAGVCMKSKHIQGSL